MYQEHSCSAYAFDRYFGTAEAFAYWVQGLEHFGDHWINEGIMIILREKSYSDIFLCADVALIYSVIELDLNINHLRSNF